MITTAGFNEAAKAISNIISHITYKKDGKEIRIEISRKEVEAETILIYSYVDLEVEGNLTDFKLITTTGETFANNIDAIKKPSTTGILIRFRFTLKEGESNV